MVVDIRDTELHTRGARGRRRTGKRRLASESLPLLHALRAEALEGVGAHPGAWGYWRRTMAAAIPVRTTSSPLAISK